MFEKKLIELFRDHFILTSDYKISDLNIKKFYYRTKSYIILFTLVVGMSFFINISASVWKETYRIIQR